VCARAATTRSRGEHTGSSRSWAQRGLPKATNAALLRWTYGNSLALRNQPLTRGREAGEPARGAGRGCGDGVGGTGFFPPPFPWMLTRICSALGDLSGKGEARGRGTDPAIAAPQLRVICLSYLPPAGREAFFPQGLPCKAFSLMEKCAIP